DFSKKNNGVTVDYQAKGSGAGIQDFINHTVDFVGSDAAMTDEEIAKVPGGVVLLPVTAGEIVLAYNLPGNPKDLELPHDVYPDIFLGKITKWNDPRIAAANPNLKLPDLPITVVRRSDSSGTTFVFTKHLAAGSRPARLDRRPRRCRRLSDCHVHLAPRLQETGCEKGGVDAKTDRVLRYYGPSELRQHGLYPVTACRGRQDQNRVGPDPI